MIKPIRMRMTDDSLVIGPEGSEVELMESVLQLWVHRDGASSTATFQLQVDVGDLDLDFPVGKVNVVGHDPLEGITAEEIDQVTLHKGMAESDGVAILRHLRERLNLP